MIRSEFAVLCTLSVIIIIKFCEYTVLCCCDRCGFVKVNDVFVFLNSNTRLKGQCKCK